MSSALEVIGITKHFGGEIVLQDVTFTVREHSLLAILGESGAGKTTLLRIVAGTEIPNHGEVRILGHDCRGLLPHERPIGHAPQSYPLFNNMKVWDNLKYPLDQVPRMDSKEKTRLVEGMLDVLHLASFADRVPSQLSGGQRQRVSLGRALLRAVALEKEDRKCVLLMDEPLASVDRKRRQQLQNFLRSFLEDHNVTIVYVTHDQDEASLLSDEIVFIKSGRVLQQSEPEVLFDSPNSLAVAESLGLGSILQGRVQLPRTSPDTIFLQDGEEIKCLLHEVKDPTMPVHVFVHPRHVTVLEEEGGQEYGDWNFLSAEALELVHHSLYVELMVRTVGGVEFGIHMRDEHRIHSEQFPFGVTLRWPIAKTYFLPSVSE